jgi:hypothetical protein
MAFLRFSHEQINYCQASVVMVLNWFRREYQASIEVYEQKKLGDCVYRVTGNGLSENKINVVCQELVSGVVVINLQDA